MSSSETDVEVLINIIDRALTSKDERVINALRSLMMITLLTDPGNEEREVGPLGELVDSVTHLNRRLASVESELSRVKQESQMDTYTKWPNNTGTDYYFDTAKQAHYQSQKGYGAIPPLTATSIADLQKIINSPLVDKKRKF